MKKTLATTLSLAVLASCGGGSSSSNSSSTETSSFFPSGLAISSPTVASGSKNIQFLLKKFGAKSSPVSIDPEADFKTKADQLASLASASAGSCSFSLPSINSIGNPPCYGPQLWYVNHLDWDNLDPAEKLGDPSDGGAANLPGGDLGLWEESSENGEACAATKLNSSIASMAQKTDAALSVAAAVSCIATLKELVLSAENSEDITSDLDSALSDADYSVASATLERLEDTAAGNEVYKINVTLQKSGSDFLTFELKHSPNSTSNSEYEGIFSVLQNRTSELHDHGFSLIYKQSSSELSYQLRYADFDAEQSFTDMFDTNGILKVNRTDPDDSGPQNAWDNFSISRFSKNMTTEDTSFNYAWQAGTGDSHTRVFQVQTETGATTSTGVAFFGFGDNFDTSTGEVPSGVITNFICNWAGPSNDHTGLVTRAQKQVMETNLSGMFVATQSLITYSPVNTCNQDSGIGNGGARNSGFGNTGNDREFWYWTGEQNNPPNNTSTGTIWGMEYVDMPAVTNNLVDISDPDNGYDSSNIPTDPELSL